MAGRKRKTISELVSEIMKRAYEVSSRNKVDIFIDYSSHVSMIKMYSYDNGWNSNLDRDYEQYAYLTSKRAIENLKKILDKINSYEAEDVIQDEEAI